MLTKSRANKFWGRIDAATEVLRNYSEMDVDSLGLNERGVYEAGNVKVWARRALSFLEGDEQGDVVMSGEFIALRALDICHDFRNNTWEYRTKEGN